MDPPERASKRRYSSPSLHVVTGHIMQLCGVNSLKETAAATLYSALLHVQYELQQGGNEETMPPPQLQGLVLQIIPHCTVLLRSTVFHCNVLQCTVQYGTAVLHCTVLQCNARVVPLRTRYRPSFLKILCCFVGALGLSPLPPPPPAPPPLPAPPLPPPPPPAPPGPPAGPLLYSK